MSCACGESVVDPGPQVLWQFLVAHKRQAIDPVPGVHYRWTAHAVTFEEMR